MIICRILKSEFKMCAGLFFKDDSNSDLGYKVYFSIPNAEIPVITKNGFKRKSLLGKA